MSQASQRATDLLRKKILSGQWSEGERLGEVELAEMLQVSRTPVREALSRLASEGLVEISPNRGARIASWSAERLNEIFDLRLLLEPVASGKAVGKLSTDEVDELDELALQMYTLGRPGTDRDFVAIAKLNRQFHATLIQASGSTQLETTLTAVRHVTLATQNYHLYTEDALARSLSHHFEIVAAIRAGNSLWVESVMCSHLHNARTSMLGPLPEKPENTIDSNIADVLI